MVIGLLLAGLAVNSWLLVILYRQGVRKELPWFVSYIIWQIVLIAIQLAAWASGSRFYIAVYWWTEAIEVLLIVAAVRESFLRIFMGFTAMRWFRSTVWAVIAAVVLYSAWKAFYV